MSALYSQWYANPLTHEQAKQLAQRAFQKRVECILTQLDADQTPACIDELVSQFWLEKDYQHAYAMLMKTNKSPQDQGLLTLVMGQLLMSRKLSGAAGYLKQGLQQLSAYLSSNDYLRLMRRHDELSVLVLAKTPSPPSSLEQLENEARVILKLKGKMRGVPRHDNKDTLG